MSEHATAAASQRSGKNAAAILSSGWLWGGALTFAFYAAIPSLPVYQAEVQRYFTAHWIEYAATGLFFVGIATLLVKATRLPNERRALATGLLDGLELPSVGTAVETVERLTAHLRLTARHHAGSHLVRRIHDVCDYVRGRRSADGLEGQLNYLADLASSRLHDGYALIRTITWAVPILGFLGTVIGITLSIANITPDQLESSLGDVTAGLAVAFDTTALSLALSMVLVFSTFLVERQEQQVLDAVEDFSMQQLVALFPADQKSPATGPLLQAEQAAAEQLLSRTESLVSWQMDAWKSSLDALRERWSATLEKQQTALDQALQNGLTQALTDHAQQLAAARQDFVAAFQIAADSLREQVATSQTALEQQQLGHLQQLQTTWAEIQSQMANAADRQLGLWDRFSDRLSGDIHDWQRQLKDVSDAMTGQLAELRQQGGILLRIVEQEEQLVRLEDRLAQNLETVRVVDTLDATLLNLNAAVNLLSAKTRGKAA